MPHFSSRTIALVRRNANAMLTETCTLYRKTGATGEMGEPLNTFEIAATGVPCRVIRARVPSGSTTQPVGGQIALVETYRLECPYNTVLELNMRSQVDGGGLYDLISIEDKLTDSAFAAAVVTRVRL